MIEDKSELYIKVCYEAYTAREASDILMKRLERSADGQVVYGNRDAAGIYSF